MSMCFFFSFSAFGSGVVHACWSPLGGISRTLAFASHISCPYSMIIRTLVPLSPPDEISIRRNSKRRRQVCEGTRRSVNRGLSSARSVCRRRELVKAAGCPVVGTCRPPCSHQPDCRPRHARAARDNAWLLDRRSEPARRWHHARALAGTDGGPRAREHYPTS